MRRFLIEDPTPGAGGSLNWQTGGAEDIGAVRAGSLPTDEAECLPTEITVGWGALRLSGL